MPYQLESNGLGRSTISRSPSRPSTSGIWLQTKRRRADESPAINDLLGGQVQVLFDNPIEHIRAGRLRALAVTTTTRWEALPDIPTLGEFVPGYDASAWFGIGAPKNTFVQIIDTLNQEINAGLGDPRIKARLADLGGMVLSGSPADFGNHIAAETEKWAKVINFAGIKSESCAGWTFRNTRSANGGNGRCWHKAAPVDVRSHVGN